jgi:hypothetical protein
VKPNINLVEFHPQLSSTGHPLDGTLVSGVLVHPAHVVFHLLFFFFVRFFLLLDKNFYFLFPRREKRKE